MTLKFVGLLSAPTAMLLTTIASAVLIAVIWSSESPVAGEGPDSSSSETDLVQPRQADPVGEVDSSTIHAETAETILDPRLVSDLQGGIVHVEATEDDSDPNNVVTNLVVSWENSSFCTDDINVYLGGVRSSFDYLIHLGSVGSSEQQMTSSLTNTLIYWYFWGRLKVICGTIHDGTSLGAVDVPRTDPGNDSRIRPGSYSSERPITSFSVSPVDFEGPFQTTRGGFTVTDVPKDVEQITVEFTAKTGYTTEFINGIVQARTFGFMSFEDRDYCKWGFYGYPTPPDDWESPPDDWVSSIGTEQLSSSVLTDADSTKSGFQIDLHEGDNGFTINSYLGERISETEATCLDIGTFYKLIVRRAEEPTPLFSSTLKVGSDTSNIPVPTGFSTYGAMDGELSSDRFIFEDASYRVLFIAKHADGLYLGMTRELPDDFTLKIGELEYVASESKEPSTAARAGYWWPADDLDWAVDDELDVSLTEIEGGTGGLDNRDQAPVAAVFSSVPESHDGTNRFRFRINFNPGIKISHKDLRDHSIEVTGGTVKRAKRVNNSNRTWQITVKPDSTADVTVALQADQPCDEVGAICSADGMRLYNALEVTIAGP